MPANTLVNLIEDTVLRCRDMDASLNERLNVIADQVRILNPSFADAVERLVRRLQESGAGINAPRPGEPMPPFLLPDDAGHLVKLEELIAAGPVAVVFNRGHWCPYCRLNTVALARANAEAEASGGRIVAITPERQKFTMTLKSWANAPFPILSDMDNAYAMQLGLAISVGGEVDRYMKIAGVDLPVYQGSDAWMLPIPATFIVGTDGLIKARYVDPDYRQRMATEDLLAALKSAVN